MFQVKQGLTAQKVKFSIKDVLQGLREFLATENLIKMMILLFKTP